jgi:hypothetical protein
MYPLFVGGLIVLGISISPTVFAANARSSLIDTYSIHATAMYEQVLIPDLVKDAKKVCATQEYSEWEKKFAAMKIKFQRNYKKLADYKKLEHTRKQFEQHQKNTGSLKTCSELVASAMFMDYVRDLHIALLESSNIIKDFEAIDIKELYGAKVKLWLIQEAAKKLEKYDWIFGGLSFSITNPQLIAKEQGEKKELINALTTLMKRTILKSLSDLKEKWLLQDADIEQFRNKMNLEYVYSCSNFHGSYRMKEVYTSTRVLVSQHVEQMKILVNVCYNYHILGDIAWLFEKIVIHELGHHMYYQKDKGNSAFTTICWTDVKTKKSECKKEAFVSAYAMSSALEDYAEQFMYSYLWLWTTKNPFLIQKDEYFLSKFPILKKK